MDFKEEVDIWVVSGESISEGLDSSPRVLAFDTGMEVYKATEGVRAGWSSGEGHAEGLESVGDNGDRTTKSGREDLSTIGGSCPDLGEFGGEGGVVGDSGGAFTDNVKDGVIRDYREFGELGFVGVEIDRFV